MSDHINPFSIPCNMDSLTALKQQQLNKSQIIQPISTKKQSVQKQSIPRSQTPNSATTNNTLQRSAYSALVDPHHSTAATSNKSKLNLSSFILQKRQLFLLSLSLQTKQNEIDKLNQQCQIKESALSTAESLLDSDIQRFDEYLQSNDRSVQESIQACDNATKLKNSQINEIKKLNHEIHKLESENHRYHDNLQLVMKYKLFLLTVQQQLHDKKQYDTNNDMVVPTNNESQTNDPGVPSATTATQPDELYFTRPEQLFDIFTQLEEKNLFLIENVQETEAALELLKTKYSTCEADMTAQVNTLQLQIDELNHKIHQETNKHQQLTNQSQLNNNMNINNNTTTSPTLMANVRHYVQQVYTRCGYENSNVDILDMLCSIELWLDKLITQINAIDIVKVELAEKQQNLQRRNIIRQNKKLQFERAYEQRLQKSTNRANSKIIKNLSKMVMKRSELTRRKINQSDNVIVDTDVEDMKQYFT